MIGRCSSFRVVLAISCKRYSESVGLRAAPAGAPVDRSPASSSPGVPGFGRVALGAVLWIGFLLAGSMGRLRDDGTKQRELRLSRKSLRNPRTHQREEKLRIADEL